jgi:MoaA/NifB/PqqE/SkfB family radical SAM enzyme
MKKNASELKEIIHLGEKLGASQFFVTNLLAYSDEMSSETLYEKSLSHSSGRWEGTLPQIFLPRMDFDGQIREDIMDLLMDGYPVRIAGNIINQNPYSCPFVARGAIVVRWDGEVSPCLPLLYEHTSIYKNWKRRSVPYSFGNIFLNSLSDIWNQSEYRELREHLLDMNFSPCVDCHTCEMSEDNLLDCSGYRHPTCGGCLWAQGVIQCP